jgi:NAD(P)-dependent dehydrogenase (short-subunit alcohol dehydrogenase family)
VSGRSLDKVEQTASQIRNRGHHAEAMVVDVTSEHDIDAAFTHLATRGEPVAAVIYNAGNNAIIPFEELTPAQFEKFWRLGAYGGYLAARRAMPLLASQGCGSMLFTGASASLRGRPNFAHFASAKAALRSLAQSLAKDYGPRGVHIAHVIIDGGVNGDRLKSVFPQWLDELGDDGSLEPDAIAEAFWHIHSQPRSAWTFELDLRPYKENW